jgi:uncharacterized protein (DUF433 family)
MRAASDEVAVGSTNDSILNEVVYQVNEAARLLHLPDKTLRRWLDGDWRHGEFTEPLIREAATGSTDVTWGEFVEAGFLREYRVRSLPIARLRPLLSGLRKELDTRYPLAEGRPLSRDGRKLLWRLQEAHSLEPNLYLVVEGLQEGYQLTLTSVVEQFVQHVEFDPSDVRPFDRWYPLGVGKSAIVLDPRRSFGLPSIRGVRTETLAELVAAGEPESAVVREFDTFGLTTADVREAVVYEHFMRQAA